MVLEEMVEASTVRIGAKVKRGRDWSWGNQDDSGPGIVDKHSGRNSSWVSVTWPDGTVNVYEAGNGTYALYYADEILRFDIEIPSDVENSNIYVLTRAIEKLTVDECQSVSAALSERFNELQRSKKAEFRRLDEVVWERDEKLIYGVI